MKFLCVFLIFSVLLTFCDTTDPKCNESGSYDVGCESKHQICKPHDVQIQGCKRCVCGISGTRWICASEGCPTEGKIPENNRTLNCTPNAIFNIDCNLCKCDSSGILAECAAKECDRSSRLKRKTFLYNPQLECSLFVYSRSGGWHLKTFEVYLPYSQLQNTKKILYVEARGFVKRNPFDSDFEFTGEFFKMVFPITETNSQDKILIYLSDPTSFVTEPQLPPRRVTTKTVKTRTTTRSTTKVTTTESPIDPNEKVYTIDDLEDPNFSCTPFKSFKLECNTCWCAKNGKGPRDCTRIACNPKTYPSLVDTNDPTNKIDEENEHDDSGELESSTEETDESSGKVYTIKDLDDPNFSCTPFKSFKLECNTCWCAKNGKGPRDCTRIACNPKTYPPLIEKSDPTDTLDEGPIEPEASNDRGSVISQSELDAESSEKIFTIEDLDDPNFSCTPFKSFKLECNTCWCAKNGKGPRDCTRIACNPKTYPPLLESRSF